MNKVNILKLKAVDLPSCLTEIRTPPKELYLLGTSINSWLDKPKVAIVGSRKVTSYGREVTSKLASQLAECGVVIISGLAYGVDTIAHESAVNVGGMTVAVLPTSLDNIYPTTHQNLAKRILESGGSLISEYPPGSTPYKVNFTARNRIVTALSDIVVITEAAVRSGTLNTANFALEQGKTVAAVPGNITSATSEGTNNLIKSGALPVTSIEDILFAIGITKKQTKDRVFTGSDKEKAVLSLIKSGVSDQELLAEQTGIGGRELASVLTTLELSGYVRPIGAGNWVLN